MLNRFAMVLGCALALGACGSDRDNNTADAGILVDAGSADTGTRRDLGPDMATEPEGCRDPLTALPTAVLPRCAATTLDSARACTFPPTDQAHVTCVTTALNADTTPPYVQDTLQFGCDDCVSYNQILCMQNNGCSQEVGDFLCCTAACTTQECVTTQCGDENQALFTCISANPTTYAQCVGFGTGSASLGCFATPAVPADAGTPDAT